MSERIPKVNVIDMIQAIEKLFQYTQQMSFEQFFKDEKTRDAVYHNILVLGEAADRMPNYFVIKHPDIEWQKIISTRNAVAHGYDEIDDKIIWNIIQNILPDLKTKLEKLLSTL